MKIETKILKEALETVKPGLANKEIIEQTSSFAFRKGQVVTYNDEICIMHPIKGLKVKGVIASDQLYKFLSKVRAKEMDVITEDSQIILKAGRSKVGFNMESKITLPLDEQLSEKSKWKTLPDKFLQAIKMARGSCTKDMSEAKLTCVHINKKGFIEGSDGHRIFNFDVGEKLPMATKLVPASSIAHVLRIEPTEVAEGKEWLHFRNPRGTTISCRIIAETYVNTEPILNTSGKGVKLNFPKELKEVLDRASIFAHRKQTTDENVAILVENKKLVVKSKSDTSWFKESLDIKHKGKPFAFNITPYLLEDIIGETTLCTIYNDRLKFKGKDWVYVTALRGTTDI